MFDLSTVSVFYENVERRIGRYQDVECEQNWKKEIKKRRREKEERKEKVDWKERQFEIRTIIKWST